VFWRAKSHSRERAAMKYVLIGFFASLVILDWWAGCVPTVIYYEDEVPGKE
jgi:hypothetical protein